MSGWQHSASHCLVRQWEKSWCQVGSGNYRKKSGENERWRIRQKNYISSFAVITPIPDVPWTAGMNRTGTISRTPFFMKNETRIEKTGYVYLSLYPGNQPGRYAPGGGGNSFSVNHSFASTGQTGQPAPAQWPVVKFPGHGITLLKPLKPYSVKQPSESVVSPCKSTAASGWCIWFFNQMGWIHPYCFSIPPENCEYTGLGSLKKRRVKEELPWWREFQPYYLKTFGYCWRKNTSGYRFWKNNHHHCCSRYHNAVQKSDQSSRKRDFQGRIFSFQNLLQNLFSGKDPITVPIEYPVRVRIISVFDGSEVLLQAGDDISRIWENYRKAGNNFPGPDTAIFRRFGISCPSNGCGRCGDPECFFREFIHRYRKCPQGDWWQEKWSRVSGSPLA